MKPRTDMDAALAPFLDTKRVALLHHWDTDGIVSAALIVRHLREKGWDGHVEFFCPRIGEYGIDDSLAARIAAQRPEAVCVLDYNVDASDIEAVSDRTGPPVLVVDHHKPRSARAGESRGRVRVLNPVAGGATEEQYPATAWVIRSLIGDGADWLHGLGVVGDLGHRAPSWLESVTGDAPWTESYDRLFRASQLIDASYKLNDTGAVESAARVLLAASSLDDVLGNTEWAASLALVDGEMERLLASSYDTRGCIRLFRVSSPMNLVSALTRLLAREHAPVPVVVLNDAYYESTDQIYVRNIGAEVARELIDHAVGRGWSAGGKDSVFAVLVPKAQTEEYVDSLVGLVCQEMSVPGGSTDGS